MSEAQKTQANTIIKWADDMLDKAHNAKWVHDNALYRLNNLCLNTRDFETYRKELNKVTGVK
jgi:hypothetical protein